MTSPMSRLLVVCEVSNAELRPSSAASIRFAQHLAQLLRCDFDIFAIGRGAASAALALTEYGAGCIYVCSPHDSARSCAESYVATVVTVTRNSGATIVMATATTWGKDLMPRVAVCLDAGYLSDCIGAVIQDGQVSYEKHLFAGSVVAFHVVETSVVALTIRESAFRLPPQKHSAPSRLTTVELQPPRDAASRIEVLGIDVVENRRPELVGAQRVVAGGRGLDKHFFDVLAPLADQLGAAIGASRAACDYGHAPSDAQVGQTGKVIAPDLYIAIGISGAVQHIAGIRGAKVIVAINSDPEAPIFSLADYGLVADAFEAVPRLVDCLRRREHDPT